MTLGEALAQEFEFESALTRRMIERVPEDKLDWAPHEKSNTLGQLVCHLVENPSWAQAMFNEDEFEMGPDYQPYVADSRARMLEDFDSNVSKCLQVMRAIPDDKMHQVWKMFGPGRELMLEMPRIAVVRSFLISHTIHHRGQLTVYYRMTGVPVPAIYGPSADEQPAGMPAV